MQLARSVMLSGCDFTQVNEAFKPLEKVVFKPGTFYEGMVGVIQDVEPGGLLSVRVGDSLRTHIKPADLIKYTSNSEYA